MARDVLMSIEQITEQTAKNGREYYSFWLRLNYNGRFITIGGWKYFPENETLSTPSQGKGDGKFVNTAKLNSAFYNDVLALAKATFGVGEKPAVETEAAVA